MCASGSGLVDRRYVFPSATHLESVHVLKMVHSDDRGPEFSIFDGDLGPQRSNEVWTTVIIMSLFRWLQVGYNRD